MLTVVLTVAVWKVQWDHHHVQDDGHSTHCYSLSQKDILPSHLANQYKPLTSLLVICIAGHSPSAWTHHHPCGVLPTAVSGRRWGCRKGMKQGTSVLHPCNNTNNISNFSWGVKEGSDTFGGGWLLWNVYNFRPQMSWCVCKTMKLDGRILMTVHQLLILKSQLKWKNISYTENWRKPGGETLVLSQQAPGEPEENNHINPQSQETQVWPRYEWLSLDTSQILSTSADPQHNIEHYSIQCIHVEIICNYAEQYV